MATFWFNLVLIWMGQYVLEIDFCLVVTEYAAIILWTETE